MTRPICEYIEKFGTDGLQVLLDSFFQVEEEDEEILTQGGYRDFDITIRKAKMRIIEEMSSYLQRGLRDEATRCKGE